MNNIYKLREIYPALKQASDPEVEILRSGIHTLSIDNERVPLMEIQYRLNDASMQIVRKYVQLS